MYKDISELHNTCNSLLDPRSKNAKTNFADRLAEERKVQDSSKQILEFCNKNNIYIYTALVPIWMQPSLEVFNLGEERTIRLRVYYLSLIKLNSEQSVYPVNWNKIEWINQYKSADK